MSERRATYKAKAPDGPRSDLAARFEFQLRTAQIGGFVREHKFHPVRRWAFDYAWIDEMIAVEIDGGTWIHGRHTRGAGYRSDCEKINEAQLMGWLVLRFDSSMVDDNAALKTVEMALINARKGIL